MAPVAVAVDPKTGELVSVEKLVEGEHNDRSAGLPDIVAHLEQKGELDKLAIMDIVSAHHRHRCDYVFSDLAGQGSIVLTNNHGAYSPDPLVFPAYYLQTSSGESGPVHPSALEWLKRLVIVGVEARHA